MSKGPEYREELLNYVLLGEAIPWVDAEADYLWISLHTDNPQWGYTQTSYETDYTGYARQPIARDAAAWTIGAGGAKNVGTITFPTPTGGDGDELNWVGLGLSETGPGQLLYSGSIMETIYTVTLPTISIPPEGLWLMES